MTKRPKRTTRGKQARGKQRSQTMPLTTASNAVRSRKARMKSARSADAGHLQKAAPDTTLFGQDALEVAAFTTRCASACANLPLRIARCGSPVELMREQARFAFEIAGNYRSLTSRALNRWLEVTDQPSSAHARNEDSPLRDSREP